MHKLFILIRLLHPWFDFRHKDVEGIIQKVGGLMPYVPKLSAQIHLVLDKVGSDTFF